MSRDNQITVLTSRSAAAAAGTTTGYHPLGGSGVLSAEGPRAAMFVGFAWLYEATEANADNTIDPVIDYGLSATFVSLFTNANANGLLDTGAILTQFINKGNAVAAAGAAVDVAVTQTRIPIGTVGNIIRITTVTAGTGTVPATQVSAIIKYV